MVESDRTGAAHVGVVGLAVMGGNLARNFASHGRTVALQAGGRG
jgi:6-phosphogluconate dehydrogenase